MAPPSALQRAANPSDIDTSLPPIARSNTAPANSPSYHYHRADPSHLAPEDAFHHAASPPRHPSGPFENGNASSGYDPRPNRPRHKHGSRSRSRRRKRFQKLLWVKQSYPDNYTDQATFLENLQRNPKLQPYDFWPLVADSTVIVQHVCSVIIFVVCFVGIFQERLSPVSVVGWGTFATVIGWLLWDWWVGQEARDATAVAAAGGFVPPWGGPVSGGRDSAEIPPPRRTDAGPAGSNHPNTSTTSISSVSNLPSAASSTSNLASTTLQPLSSSQESNTNAPYRRPSAGDHHYHHHHRSNSNTLLRPRHAHSTSASSLHSATSQPSNSNYSNINSNYSNINSNYNIHLRSGGPAPPDYADRTTRPSSPTDGRPGRGGIVGRNRLRMSTIKSAVLIYFTLLALSPILKSLTRSTSSDSIWAMSFWLLTLNIFFFDYSGAWFGVNKFPVASLSTNAALMASTVLASRLPSTGQVFSLTLFSIEVFGLFPVFRRYARHRSWRYHVLLTVLLVLGAGAGVGMVLAGNRSPAWPWRGCLLGMLVGCLIAALAMGGCSWWLIGLQKYKNEIYGPWDPARPIIISRRHWDDE